MTAIRQLLMLTLWLGVAGCGGKGEASGPVIMNDQQLEATKAKLLALKPNIRKVWSTGGELTNLFQNHEVAIAMGWPLMTNQLRALNFPIGETIPKENTTGWIDHLMITSASNNKELAHEFLEYMTQAKTQKAVADYLPSRDIEMLEYMELLAVFEASNRRMLPAKYARLTIDELQSRLAELRGRVGRRR